MIDIVWEYFWVWNTKNSKFQVSGLWTDLNQHACRCITLNIHQILMFFWNVLENIVWLIIQNNPFAIKLSHKLAIDNFCFDFEETKWFICLKICQMKQGFEVGLIPRNFKIVILEEKSRKCIARMKFQIFTILPYDFLWKLWNFWGFDRGLKKSYNSLRWIQSRNSLPKVSFNVSFWDCINHWFRVSYDVILALYCHLENVTWKVIIGERNGHVDFVIFHNHIWTWFCWK